MTQITFDKKWEIPCPEKIISLNNIIQNTSGPFTRVFILNKVMKSYRCEGFKVGSNIFKQCVKEIVFKIFSHIGQNGQDRTK